MLGRVLTALTMAICGVLATTGVSSAAIEVNDRDDVMLVSAIFWGAVVFVAFLFYLVRHAFGLDKMPPPDAQDGHGGHH